MATDGGFYTIVDECDGTDKRVEFTVEDGMIGQCPVHLELPSDVLISPTQLSELGMLFLALSGNSHDPDDCQELIAGYEIKGLEYPSL